MAEKLTSYLEKRNFSGTPEPTGGGKPNKKKRKRLRFVVQHHLARREHYDFRLEYEGVLLSWAVPKGPSFNPKDKRLAVRVEDHPYEYKDFEGEIPKGEYGGGTVMLWDEGEYEPTVDFDEGLKNGSVKITLYGERLKGGWALVRLKSEEKAENWLLIKEKDAFALPAAAIGGFTKSVRSGRTMEEIKKGGRAENAKNPFSAAPVMLAKLTQSIPKGKDWLYEIKYDGYRITAYTEGGDTRLYTRAHKDYTRQFQSAADAVSELAKGRSLVLDGEMIVTDGEGKPNFQALQGYVKNKRDARLFFAVFDVLAYNGEDVRIKPLRERRKLLEGLLKDAPPDIILSKSLQGEGRAIFEAAQELGLEGIMIKSGASPYRGERSGDWLKMKCYRRQEFVIGGYTRTDKKTEGISALLLGVYDNGALRYIGRAGTGIGGRQERELLHAFKGKEAARTPFKDAPKKSADEALFWLKPRLLAEVQYAEITGEGLLRQASYKGLRQDKAPEEVTLEEQDLKVKAAAAERESAPKKARKNTAAGSEKIRAEDGSATVCGVTITSPEKVVFAEKGITKMDVVRYYHDVSRRMLAFTAGRVLSVVRCHKGVEACFYKKHPVKITEGIAAIDIKNSEGDSSQYFYIQNERGLISEVQLGSLEFHIWGSRAQSLERPDMMVFDLDPDEGMELARVREGVRDLKKVLSGLGLKSFLKTSGGKGYHVVVPLKAEGWEQFYAFARRVAEYMAASFPDKYTANMRKEKRRGKIYIDFGRNNRGSTSVAPYSLRARAGARVSLPIAWSELDKIAPDGIDMAEALARLKKRDPWAEFFQVRQSLDKGGETKSPRGK